MVNFKNLTITKESGASGGREKYVLAPLPKGYGATLGNSLRRVLLSSLQGAAIYQAKIKGVTHQFSTIKGVKEDVVEILLNFKQVRLKMDIDNPQVLILKVSKVGKVTAGDISAPAGVEVINKSLPIATLSKGAEFNVELMARKGFGYKFSETQEVSKVGVLALDTSYSPVAKVAWSVSETRVGAKSDFDKLVLDIETDGSISPKSALVEASAILRDFFEKIAKGAEAPMSLSEPEDVEAARGVAEEEESETSKIPLEEIPSIPSRTVNALRKAKIETVGSVLERDWDELLAVKNMGKKSVDGLREAFEKEGFNKKS
jgi:DNA-directed RNA polymerase subunit alpha